MSAKFKNEPLFDGKGVDADDGLLFGDDLVNSRDPAFSRQNDDGDDEDVTEDPTGNDVTGPGGEEAAAGNDEIRCVPKVMQVRTQNNLLLLLGYL